MREAAQSFLLPLWNALSFFTIYANLDGWHPDRAPAVPLAERADLDRWILWRLDQLVGDDGPNRDSVTGLLSEYAVTPAARKLEAFLDDLTNWYIRRSRQRFWSADAPTPSDAKAPSKGTDKEAAYQTLYEVLTTLARVVAPFTPFVAEQLHETLVRSIHPDAEPSVHLEEWPRPRGILDQLTREGRSDLLRLVESMQLAQRVIGLARAARASHNLKTRQPLPSMVLVFSREAQGMDIRAQVERVRDLILDEVNVKEIRWAEQRGEFVHHEVRPNFRVLGKKLGKRMKAVQAALGAADGDLLAEALERDGALRLEVEGETIELAGDDLEVRLIEKEGLATAHDREILVALDTHLTPELVAEGRAREVVNRIQGARKEAGLDYADRIRVRYRAAPEIEAAIDAFRDWIAGETLTVEWQAGDGSEPTVTDVDGHELAFQIASV